MTKTHNIKPQGILKHGLAAALIATMSFSALVSATNISTAGAKKSKYSTTNHYSKTHKNIQKNGLQGDETENWGRPCNNYGPPGSINYHGHGKPAECGADTYNPFTPFHDRRGK